ncbi:2,3-bisphosphoglycerate-independent phosphoglycerate mutase [Methylococcus sp. EFPC2]|uniref:2,3-bisphosphoglycerate-independent phosphoglycerate mutase n=1 Tax=Methylococcus sp. EFPC2 TaxID=2812648 RepID=UPI001F0823B8|nr:2,3-bisphosphoglycerate-independent phosphoglycerate mutase [Methylococcus sp. EFPC2]
MKSHRPKPIVLLIFDGFGYSELETANAIRLAHTPNWDGLWANSPHTLLECSGGAVGLPDDQMGNSEVGHLHLGCGRLLAQDLTRINQAIANRTFFDNPVLRAAVDQAKTSGKALHILGLLSPGGVHSHETHIHALVELALSRGLSDIYLHAFLDGRDTPPKSAEASIRATEARLAELGGGRIASLTGRFYAMDRDNRWERVSQAYELLAHGKPEFSAASAVEGLAAAYARGETDEFVKPTAITPEGTLPVAMQAGDVVVFMNFRADRARELSLCLTQDDFQGFERGEYPRLGAYVTLTEYHEDFSFPVAFPPTSVKNGLGEVLANSGLKQLRLAETEKYAHVTFFFNGGTDTPFPGEERILVPSPKVKTYDLKPEMSAPEVTDRLVEAIEGGEYDVIICNYANGDMVGHTGVLSAAIAAVETLDASLGRVLAALDRVGGELVLTADHGNAEQMIDPETGEAQTAHTVNPVPLVYRGSAGRLADGGNLADVSPTLLAILGLDRPAEMTGRSLLI